MNQGVIPFEETVLLAELPVLEQDPELEAKIRAVLSSLGTDTFFHLCRYLVWPNYKMRVYYYVVGLFEIQIEQHTSSPSFYLTGSHDLNG